MQVNELLQLFQGFPLELSTGLVALLDVLTVGIVFIIAMSLVVGAIVLVAHVLGKHVWIAFLPCESVTQIDDTLDEHHYNNLPREGNYEERQFKERLDKWTIDSIKKGMSADVIMSRTEAEAILNGLSLPAYTLAMHHVQKVTKGRIPPWCDEDHQEYLELVECVQTGQLATILGDLAEKEIIDPNEAIVFLQEGDKVLYVDDGQQYTVDFQVNKVRVYLRERPDGWVPRKSLQKLDS